MVCLHYAKNCANKQVIKKNGRLANTATTNSGSFPQRTIFSRCGIETARNVCPGKFQQLKCATLSINTVAEHVSDM